ncbi:major facilitator superfamily domain-containing protein [Aspergillus granulosus]|uniref:Major facilitator superfamily domain-containing protein n=1 Tax=Aspergillus granulosus TaxID=176169 RepID=A0ABR4HSU1_9EURO
MAHGIQVTPHTKSDRAPDLEGAAQPQTSHAEVVEKHPMSAGRIHEHDTAMALFDSTDDLYEEPDPQELRRLRRKIDMLIMPCLLICFAFFYIDKVSPESWLDIHYAAIFGIIEDLDLRNTEYNWLSSFFYVGFIAWAIPTNFLLQRLPLAKYLGASIFLWGALLMIQAVCHNFATLAVLRAIGGALEGCADPAFLLVTSMWYTREEQPIRIGIWHSGYGVGVATGGLLGYAIGHIKGALPSWKYEFLVIGALCAAWGIVIFIFLPDSPVNARLFTKRERQMVVERMRNDQTGIENKYLKWYQVKEALLDYKLYILFAQGVLYTIPNGGFSNFGTIIVKGFGFSTLGTTLLQIPYGAVICLAQLSCAFVNSKFQNRRTVFVIIYLIPTLVAGFGMRYVSLDQKVGRLICYYLTGFYPGAWVLVLSMIIANISGYTKKIVMNIGFFLGYSAGNLAGPFFYRTQDQPTYPLGMWSMIVCSFVGIVLSALLGFLLRRENKRRDHIQSLAEGGLEGRDLAATAFLDMTDKENLNFRYIY